MEIGFETQVLDAGTRPLKEGDCLARSGGLITVALRARKDQLLNRTVTPFCDRLNLSPSVVATSLMTTPWSFFR